MLIQRRTLIASLLAACAFPAAAQANVVTPEQFGARGDGRSDDTRALQRCLDAAGASAIVRLRRGAVYRIDTNHQASWNRFGGLKLRDGQRLELNGAELRALPSSQSSGAVVQAHRVSGWRISGPGRIGGERSVHRGRGGEWGMGIAAFSSDDWTVENVEIVDCWGDGLYVGTPGAPGEYCHDFLIDRVSISDCRRNGISITAGRNGEIRSPRIRKIDGTNPQGGIDLEPDHSEHPNRDIVIRDGSTRDVQVGIYVTVANEGVLITGMDLEGHNSGIIIGDNARDVRIEDNPRIVSLIGGEEGSALRTVVARPASVTGLQIRRNLLRGGGHFVIDIVGDGYRQLVIADNRIEATNRGVQGIGRIGGGTFVDNDMLIGAAAGKADDYFLILSNVTRGRNTYRNQSPFRMHNVILGGRDLGGERYDSTLRPWIERR